MKRLVLITLLLTGCASSGDLAKLQADQMSLAGKVDANNKQINEKLDNFFKKIQQK